MFNRSKRSNVSGSLGVRVPSVPVNCIQRWAVGWTWCLFWGVLDNNRTCQEWAEDRQCWGGEGKGWALTTLGLSGRVAAQNMLAQEAEINTVPYLWTAMFGKSLRYAGN